jgi:hypothetical protein
MYSRSLIGFLDQHALDKLVELGRKVLGNSLILTLDNALSQLVERLGIEGRL